VPTGRRFGLNLRLTGFRYPYNDTFNFWTVAIQLGQELWVGSVRGDKVARFPMP